MAARAAPAHSWLMERRYLSLVIVVLFIFLSAITFFICYRQFTIHTDHTLKEDRAAANLLSIVLDERVKKIISVMESYSQRPLLIQAAKNKNVKDIRYHLIDLVKSNPDIDFVIISDRGGTPWATSYPGPSSVTGKNFSDRDWYKGVSKEWKPYITDVVLRVVEERDLAVQISVPCINEKKDVVGILVNTQRTVGLSHLLEQATRDPETSITVTDRKGQIIFRSGQEVQKEIRPYPFHAGMKKAMAVKNKTFAVDDPDLGESTRYISFAPVAGIGWTVFVERNKRDVLLSDSSYYIQVTAIAFLLFLSIVLFLAYSRKQITAQDLQEQLQTEKTIRASQEAAEQLAEEMVGIAEIGRVIGSTLEIDQVFDRIAAEIGKRIPFDSLIVNRSDVQKEMMHILYASGLVLPGRSVGDRFPMRGTLAEEVARTGRGVIIQSENPREIVEKFPSLAVSVAAGMRSMMSVPLISQGEVIGSLLMRTQKTVAYSEENLRLAERIGMQIAGAIVNAQLFGNLKKTENALRESIADHKKIQEEIRRLNVELEQRVLDRTARLDAANKELEAFSYSVSHDLRAPLRSINGFSQALLEEYQGILDETGKTYLERVCRAAQRMGVQIDDMMTLSKVTKSEFNPEAIDLSAMVRAIDEARRENHPNRAIDLTVQEGVVVRGDPRLMKIAMENLMDNAFKFTGKEANPRIEFGTMASDGKTICFIRDNGAGFDMAYAGKLFGAFQRLHAKEEFAGSGIGLATVQRIINRHGGRIWAEGAVGKGATFYFTLP